MNKTGLVLEGGGVRGIYVAGVLDVFLEQDIHFDGVIGNSAGAIHGCSYLSDQAGRSIRYYKKYCADPRFMSFRSFLKTGDLVGVDFCYHELPDRLDPYDHDAFLRCGVPFYTVCTNLETGKAEYLQITDMKDQIDILRASASLPYFSRPVSINGRLYLDGGCADSIPVKAFQSMGYGRNVLVLTQPADYQKTAELTWLPKLCYHRYPAFAEALRNRHTAYNRATAQIREMERSNIVFIIRPEQSLAIGRMEKDPENVQRVYDQGRADALKALPSLKKWLEA